MLVTDDTLRRVDQHWAVLAIGEDSRDRGLHAAKARLVRSTIGIQLTVDFEDQETDNDLLQRLSTAYEFAAIEGLDAVLHPSSTEDNQTIQEQCYAGAWRAFELRRLLPIPQTTDDKIFHILHLAALAYCGDRWVDIRRWILEYNNEVAIPDEEESKWDRRILHRLYDCWIRLLRKNSWDDLSAVGEIIHCLRKDQDIYEKGLLSSDDSNENRVIAYRLVALYHWAKATELLSQYMLQGRPGTVNEDLDKHFEKSRDAARAAQDIALEVIQRWLHVAARRMVESSIWWIARSVNSQTTDFVENITRSQAIFELLPPQRAALREQGLLDQAHRAIVVDLPTSGGKTLLAEFRILQAINQFYQDRGWVAYVAPTKALVTQITRRLRRDLNPIGITVEQLTGAIEIDAFEDAMFGSNDDQSSFDVLVATPEKLQLVIRNKRISRPLALIVMDEAHNLEGMERGLRIELLLATIRRECEDANFLLLMPDVPNVKELANWLAPEAGNSISIGAGQWRPNEKIVGLYEVQGEGHGDWTLRYETLVTTSKAMQLGGRHQVGDRRPIDLSYSKVRGSLIRQTGAMAKVFSERGTSIAVANTIPNVWSMARTISKEFIQYDSISEEIALVQKFLESEISPEFELISMLSRGVGVHHAGLSDEIRSLIEWLAEERKLRVLCATTTIAQGINFPVSSVFLSSLSRYSRAKRTQVNIAPREFWNLAGRAGRIDHDTIGVVGIAAGRSSDDKIEFIARATGSLVSRLVTLLNEVEKAGELRNLNRVIHREQWRDFRCFVAHLWAEKQNLEAVLSDTENLLRSTFGYRSLQSQQEERSRQKATALLDATKSYVEDLAPYRESTTLADSTGFDPEGVRKAIYELGQLDESLEPADWTSDSLFGEGETSSLSNLIGVMLQVPELHRLGEVAGLGLSRQRIASIISDWVNGESIDQIARSYFGGSRTDLTDAVTNACKAIYRVLATNGPWGIAALSKMPLSGLDFDGMTEEEVRRINLLPALVYHGVRTEPAVLMRMNSIPRSIAETLGQKYVRESSGDQRTVGNARVYIRSLSHSDWDSVVPAGATMTGSNYNDVWKILSGEL